MMSKMIPNCPDCNNTWANTHVSYCLQCGTSKPIQRPIKL